MKYCVKCGNEMVDEAVICVKCGCAAGDLPTAPQQAPQQAPQPVEKKPSSLATAAKILMIISTVASALGTCCISLAWCLPMTISYSNKIKAGQPVSTGFKVCTLLFVSMISGILMLCDEE